MGKRLNSHCLYFLNKCQHQCTLWHLFQCYPDPEHAVNDQHETHRRHVHTGGLLRPITRGFTGRNTTCFKPHQMEFRLYVLTRAKGWFSLLKDINGTSVIQPLVCVRRLWHPHCSRRRTASWDLISTNFLPKLHQFGDLIKCQLQKLTRRFSLL